MKLDTEKNVLLCQKALYAHQLYYYSELCKKYEDFATHPDTQHSLNIYTSAEDSKLPLSDRIQNHFGSYLSQAVNRDFSRIDSSPLLSKEQKDILHSYSFYATEIRFFQNAATKLERATYENDTFDIAPDYLEEYHDFMQSHKSTRKFDDFIDTHKANFIGRNSYLVSRYCINEIHDIDPNHISLRTLKSLTPRSFGATVKGPRGTLHPMSKENMKRVVRDDLSFSEIAKNEAYTLGAMATDSTKEFYTAHKNTINKALKKAAVIALAVGMVYAGSKGVEKIVDAHEFNNEAYMGNPAYEQSVNDETMQMMQEVDEYLTSLENSSSIPTADELRHATELVDNSGNMIMDNLIRNSFASQFENLTIPDGGVVIHYNKNHDNMSDGSLGNYVYITCQDENGKEYQYVIKDFRSQGENRVKRLFDDERNIDEQRKDIDDVYNDNFTMNSQNAKKYLASLREMYNNNVELAGSVIVINSPQINYDNAKANDEESLGDKFRLEMSKIFCIDPKIKTVTPEKVENEQQPLTVETIETSGVTNEHEISDDDDAR